MDVSVRLDRLRTVSEVRFGVPQRTGLLPRRPGAVRDIPELLRIPAGSDRQHGFLICWRWRVNNSPATMRQPRLTHYQPHRDRTNICPFSRNLRSLTNLADGWHVEAAPGSRFERARTRWVLMPSTSGIPRGELGRRIAGRRRRRSGGRS